MLHLQTRDVTADVRTSTVGRALSGKDHALPLRNVELHVDDPAGERRLFLFQSAVRPCKSFPFGRDRPRLRAQPAPRERQQQARDQTDSDRDDARFHGRGISDGGPWNGTP